MTQTQASSAPRTDGYARDRETLRALARRLAEIAALPEQQDGLRRWVNHNGLRPERPMVMLDGIPWHEMNVDDELTVRSEDPFCRGVELMLRRTLYQWNHMRGDMVIRPEIVMPKVLRMDGFGIRVQTHVEAIDPGNDVVSSEFVDQAATEEDLERIHTPTVELDAAMTAMVEERSHDLFDGILPVRMQGWLPEANQWPALAAEPGTKALVSGMWPDGAGNLAFGAWDLIVMWRGAEPTLFDMADRPEFMHRLMRKVTDAHMGMLDQIESNGWLGSDQSFIRSTGAYTDELPAEGFDPAHPRTIDVWTSGMAQILTAVSPKMFGEYEIDYAIPWFERFGLVYYGCCEALDNKMDHVRRIPNLRKVSMSSWVNVERGAEQIGRDFVFSRKPNPAWVADHSWDPGIVERDLRKTIEVCARYDTPLELILKGISTVGGKPHRLWEWTDIAMRLVNGG
jgi:hypothetical protein